MVRRVSSLSLISEGGKDSLMINPVLDLLEGPGPPIKNHQDTYTVSPFESNDMILFCPQVFTSQTVNLNMNCFELSM